MLVLIYCSTVSYTQNSKKVLFLGNSYTSANNLPSLISNLALSTGDTMIYDSNTPGGSRLMDHAVNVTSINKINADSWDFVVLQAQSQEPSWSDWQVGQEVFPYATQLCDMIEVNDSCTMPLFYMTWGRESGDALNCGSWPPVCTYEGMDSILERNYRLMGEQNQGLVSPVGRVWRYLRTNYPAIDLYQADGSHPSIYGSYAAACSFYTLIFQKDPTDITFDATLTANDAEIIRNVTRMIVFDSLELWGVGQYNPIADFSFSIQDSVLFCYNSSANAFNFSWSMGDGSLYTDTDVVHTYPIPGIYEVQLIASKCQLQDTMTLVIEIGTSSILKNELIPVVLFPNPTNNSLNIQFGKEIYANYYVSDIHGRIYLENQFEGSELQLDISHLSAGIYAIHFDSIEQISISFVKK